MDEFKITERVLSRVAGRGKEYEEYFEKKLKKWNVSSPAEITEEKKEEFFKEVDDGWQGEGEKKEAKLISRRWRDSGCEKLPEGGMRDNCEKKVEEGKDKEAGCEKLPEGGMRDNCEKKVEEGKKDDDKEKKANN